MKTLIISCTISIMTLINTSLFGVSTTPIRNFKTYDFKNFDKLNFKNINGDIEVVIGKTWSVNIEASDEQLDNFVFDYDAKEYKLEIDYQAKGRYNYNEPKIKIYVTMPGSSVISNQGNGNVKIKNVLGRYFRYEKNGNGDTEITGEVDTFDIKSVGNGDIKAKTLISKLCDVKTKGNGNISVNSQISLKVSGSGNGDVIQYGEGKISSLSGILGNGQVIIK